MSCLFAGCLLILIAGCQSQAGKDETRLNALLEQENITIGIAVSEYDNEYAFAEQDFGYVRRYVVNALAYEDTTLQETGVKLIRIKSPADFCYALANYDIVLYKGHSRQGVGPAIRNPVDFFFVGGDRVPFSIQWLFRIIEDLRFPEYTDQRKQQGEQFLFDCPIQSKLVVFFSCDSQKYFGSYFQQHAPDTLFIGFDGPVDEKEKHLIEFCSQVALRRPIEDIIGVIED